MRPPPHPEVRAKRASKDEAGLLRMRAEPRRVSLSKPHGQDHDVLRRATPSPARRLAAPRDLSRRAGEVALPEIPGRKGLVPIPDVACRRHAAGVGAAAAAAAHLIAAADLKLHLA